MIDSYLSFFKDLLLDVDELELLELELLAYFLFGI